MCQAGILKAESTCVALLVELAPEPQHTQGRRGWRQDLDISRRTGKVSKGWTRSVTHPEALAPVGSAEQP